ncbi:glycoside hydrolase family 3 N-terminal domain-containing protein, partial [Streptomyces sp. HSW2009]|uniref:glycoside hydrolase family 3 N-terminal domain-containing protein n=1 Tax=Streptomyces sp. HSW2009 TaxID=3142890 RepID=UPI0032ECFC26
IIHGYRTIFPVPLAIGCSWDEKAAEKVARVSAKEASAAGVHVTFSPMVDLVRDARWGRVMESTGEDPFLNSVFARAFVR